MVSLTLKVILHVAENDSKYHDVAPLKPAAVKSKGCIVQLHVLVVHPGQRSKVGEPADSQK